jgi:transposase
MEKEYSTVGLDLGDRFSNFCVLDEQGEVMEEGRLATTQEALARKFSGMDPCRIALEVCTYSPWVSRLLKGLGHEVVVAQAAKVALIYKNHRKGDQIDAQLLAKLARVDPSLLSPIEHRGLKTQQDLQVVRSRNTLVEARTKLINHVRSSAKVFGVRLGYCSAECFHKKIPELLPEALRVTLGHVLETIGVLTAQIHAYEKEMAALCQAYPATELLQQVPGVGPVTALSFVLTIERPERFRKSRDIGPYLGLVPKRDQSGETDKHLRISKAGDVFLRKLLVTCAHYILGPKGPDCALRRWAVARLGTGGANAKKRTVVAVARKLAVLLHRLWITGECYQPFPQGLCDMGPSA